MLNQFADNYEVYINLNKTQDKKKIINQDIRSNYL